jgi:rfaE bifunctional protein kinase chain/domain
VITLERLDALLARFPSRTIGLVGDLFLDRYLDVDPQLGELSIETGLEAYQITRIRNYPGALGTVMNNLAALGVGMLVPATVLGDDGQAFDLLQALKQLPVDPSHVLRDAGRLTPTYTKPMRQGADGVWRELNRLDLRNHAPLSAATEDRLLEHITQVFGETDGLIVLDQVNEAGWGVVTQRVREHLHNLWRNMPDKLIFVDSRAQVSKFNFGTLKPNVSECIKALGRAEPMEKELSDLRFARQAAAELSALTGRPLFCTLGPQGMLVVRKDAEPVLVPSYRVTGPIDIVGAGDSATAGIVASLLAAASPVEAAAVGNLVASITVQQIGVTGTASPQQVRERLRQSAG